MEKPIESKQSNFPKELETTLLSRPKVSIYIASSIDGYIARKDGNLDWLHYGHTGDEDYGFKKFTSSIDAVVMGRNTYEVVAGFDDRFHSPNVIPDFEKEANIALRDIKKGEELSIANNTIEDF